MIRKLCIITQYYPTVDNPIFSFVGVLVNQFAEMGIECHVIAPMNSREDRNKSESRIIKLENGNKIYIHCPKTRILINRKIGKFEINMLHINTYMRYFATLREYQKHVKDVDAIYAHFFLESGTVACMLGRQLKKKVFVACGESIEGMKLSAPKMRSYYNLWNKYLTGVIAVSSVVKENLFRFNMLPAKVEKDTRVYINGVNLSVFYPRNKKDARQQLHIPHDVFTIVFVGFFCERKGYFKIKKILEHHQDLYGILIGDVDTTIKSKRICMPGKIKNVDLPLYLSAADVFVLPTLSEGCCNAIIEAMACGLPVISSDRSFNKDIIDEKCSIQIDPEDDEQIEQSIYILKNNKEQRVLLGKNALERAKKMGIDDRAKNIISFISEKSLIQ